MAFRGIKRAFECFEVSKASMLGNEGQREFGIGQQVPGFVKLAAQNRGAGGLTRGSAEPPDEHWL